MELQNNLNKKIAVLGLIIILIFALWLVMNLFKKEEIEVPIETKAIPEKTATTQFGTEQKTVIANSSSIMLKPSTEKTSYSINEPIKLSIYANSKSTIVSYDAVIIFDSTKVKYTSVSSSLTDFKVWPWVKDNKLMITGVQPNPSKEGIKLTNNLIAEVIFTPLAAGTVNFDLSFEKSKPGGSSLRDTSSNNILDQVAGVKIDIK